jgi:hypothetical protein
MCLVEREIFAKGCQCLGYDLKLFDFLYLFCASKRKLLLWVASLFLHVEDTPLLV